MEILVTNNYFGTPLLWGYNEGTVERIPLEDFNSHNELQDDYPHYGRLPLDLYEIIIKYTMDIRLSYRNFNRAFRLCTLNRRACSMFYVQIYGETHVPISIMLNRLATTFEIAENIYEDYLACPNPTASGLNAINLTRSPRLRFQNIFDPWDFNATVEVQKMTIDEEEALHQISVFPGQFHGDTIWLHGEEFDGIYNAKTIHHPVLVLILSDYTYALIPTRSSIKQNWVKFSNFLRRAFGARTGVYIMVKHQIDLESPFIETTDQFLIL